jgi:hypothetical protein
VLHQKEGIKKKGPGEIKR